jgi:Cupin domain
MELLHTPGSIDKRSTMYPTYSMLSDSYYVPAPHSTTYGVVLKGTCKAPLREWKEGEYFSHFCYQNDRFTVENGCVWFVTRLGFQGQEITGNKIEETGRLSYIDNCSSSILVYPPRLGDPSLHLLYFPPNTIQTFHTHPSIRVGLVLSGTGFADCKGQGKESRHTLSPGSAFCLNQQEEHRFRTDTQAMRIIAYHPDGDWGPTDENHPMLNRTHIKAQ